MKKLILFAAILFAGVSVANAQGQVEKNNTTPGNDASVTTGTKLKATTDLTVILNSIQSISVNTGGVTLEYTTVDDYEKGVRSGIIKDHLQVYSTGAYNVNVYYSDATDNSYAGPTEGLGPNAMFESINVSIATKKEGTSAVATSMLLAQETTATTTPLISSAKGVFGETFDVEYQGDKSYMNSIKGGAKRTYTATVNYAIIAK